MRLLTISKTPRYAQSRLQREEVTWDWLAERLQKVKRSSETLSEYLAWDQAKQLEAKDIGGYIPGAFEADRRKALGLQFRSAITLDIDKHAEGFEAKLPVVFGAYEYFWHTSRKHRPEAPRIRVVFPLTRDVTKPEYQAIARMLASWFNIDAVDIVTFNVAQIMFWPSVCKDGEFRYGENVGAWLDPDAFLTDNYLDHTDKTEWPRTKKDKPPEQAVEKVQDPTTKPGLIGAFCRAFTIYDVLEDHIAGAYEGTDDEARWRYHGSEGGAGAQVYDDGLHLYSNHANNDPAAGRSVNAWDLVRIHKFGALDDDAAPGTAASQMPSFRAMEKYASTFKEVISELESTTAFDDESDDLGLDDVDTPRPQTKPVGETRDELLSVIDQHQEPETLPDMVLPQVVAAGLNAVDTARVLNAIDARCKHLGMPAFGKRVLQARMRELKEAMSLKDEARAEIDLEMALVNRVLREHYGNGKTLKRFAKSWWHYRGGVWGPIEEEVIGRRVMETLLKIKSSDPGEFDRLVLVLRDSGREDRLGALVSATMSILTWRCAEDGNDDPLRLKRVIVPSVVNCRNGEIWFNHDGEFELRQHRPESLLTSQLAVEYTPGATCPTWDQALQRVFADSLDPDEQIRHFHEVMGYLIQPTREIATWVLLKGPGGNGKSFLMSIIAYLLGDTCLLKGVADLAKRDNHFEHSLFGKLLFLDDDYAKGTLLPDDWLKKLSEAKPVTANPKFGGTYTMISRAIITILSNSWPHTKDLSEGMRRRAVVFEMPRSLPASERDPRHKETILRNELPGVLNLLLAGWQRVIRRGYAFDTPGECEDAKQTWLKTSNPVARFVDEMTDRVSGAETPAPEMFDAYRNWMVMSGEGAKPLGRNSFYGALRDVGVGFREFRRHQIFTGVRLRAVADIFGD